MTTHIPCIPYQPVTTTHNHSQALKLSIDEPSEASRADEFSGQLPPPSWRKLRTLSLWLDGKLLTDTNSVASSALVRGLSVKALSLAGPRIGAAPAEVAEIVAPGMSLAISSGSAKKYPREASQVRWAHLNLKIKSTLPRGAEGVIAELAEVRPLSELTESYLAVPRIVAQHRTHKRTRAKKAQLEKTEASALLARAPNKTNMNVTLLRARVLV